jgi:nucleotide-binding universal stress UspA family protein
VKFHRMLVPLDGSELAEKVLVYVKELAGRLDLDVTLLYVCNKEEFQVLPMHRSYVERAAELAKTQIEAVRASIGGKSKAKAGQVVGRVTVGYAAEEILRHTDENNIDLILMTTHGRSGIKRWVLGSVADKVLRASRVPVLLIRAGIHDDIAYDKWPKTTIVVPLDGSKLAESVLPHAEALAKQRGLDGAELVLLRVTEPPTIPSDYPAAMPESWEEHVERETSRRKHESQQYLAGVEKRLKDAGFNVRSEVLVGNPAEEIVGHCSRNRFSLIVIATHGRSGISRWAYGSVAEKVLVGSSNPILVVRPR